MKLGGHDKCCKKRITQNTINISVKISFLKINAKSIKYYLMRGDMKSIKVICVIKLCFTLFLKQVIINILYKSKAAEETTPNNFSLQLNYSNNYASLDLRTFLHCCACGS